MIFDADDENIGESLVTMLAVASIDELEHLFLQWVAENGNREDLVDRNVR